MGQRAFYKKLDEYPYLSFTKFWNTAGYGRWYKKRLSKLRRLAAKREIRGLHVRKGVYGWESEVNWRGW